MPIGAQGFAAKAAFRIEGLTTTYPTTTTIADSNAETLGAYDMIPLMSESLSEGHEFEMDNTVVGNAGISASDKVNIAVAGDIKCSLTYDGLTQLIYAAMGFEDPRAVATGDPEYLSPTALTSSASSGNTGWDDTGTPFASGDVGKFINVKTGTGEGGVRRIITFTDSNTVVISDAWATNPSNTNTGEMATAFRHFLEPDHQLLNELFESEDNYPTGGVGTSSDKKIRRGTFAVDKQISSHEFDALMLNGFTIEAKSGGSAIITFPAIGFNLDLRTSSRNSSSSTWNYTPSAHSSCAELNGGIAERAMFNDLVVRIDDWSNSVSLGSGDEVKLSEISITLNNNLEGGTRDAVSGLYAVEPARAEKHEVTFSMTMPRYEADDFLTDLKADTIKMADIIWTGGTISDSDTAKIEIFLFAFKWTSWKGNIDGPGLTPITLTGKCLIPTATSSGFPTLVKSDAEMAIRLTNRFPFNASRAQDGE